MSVPTTIAMTTVAQEKLDQKTNGDSGGRTEASCAGRIRKFCKNGVLLPVLAVTIWVLAGTIVYKFVNDWHWGQAFYYAVQAGLSVGFGALPETKVESQFFTIFFVLLGSSAVGGVLALFTELAMDKHESVVAQIKTPKGRKSYKLDHSAVAGWCKSHSQVILALSFFFAWILIGAFFAQGRLETGSFITAIYFAVTACSTGGLFAPTACGHDDACFVFVGLYCLVGIPLFGYALGQFANVFIQKYSDQKADELMSQKITRAEYDFAANLNHGVDGKVDFAEFVILSMLRLGSIDVETLEDLKEDFDGMDQDRSGHLDYEEIVRLFGEGREEEVSGATSTGSASLTSVVDSSASKDDNRV